MHFDTKQRRFQGHIFGSTRRKRTGGWGHAKNVSAMGLATTPDVTLSFSYCYTDRQMEHSSAETRKRAILQYTAIGAHAC